jgi:hypothetical protein
MLIINESSIGFFCIQPYYSFIIVIMAGGLEEAVVRQHYGAKPQHQETKTPLPGSILGVKTLASGDHSDP